MSEVESYSEAKEQLDAIVAEVRKKDVPLERSLDLLEEGVRLANRCTELIDRSSWEAADSVEDAESDGTAEAGGDADGEVAADTDGGAAPAAEAQTETDEGTYSPTDTDEDVTDEAAGSDTESA
ncbi:MAG: exodeoxyribonuclease VII small subunit [Actinomycetes bacterium]|jgi:exodeoxyribonuclease VII small subunit|nr:exodeoxyribonuclease VII small subunit [Actinomycetes bacterium]